MGVFTYEEDLASSIPAHRLFKAIALEYDIIVPKVAPHAIKSSEIIEGDGGPGSIRKITFTEGSHFKHVKYNIEVVEKESFTCGYSLTEGEALMDKFEKISYESKFIPNSDGGCICKRTCKYYTKPGFEFEEHEAKAEIEKTKPIFNAIVAYLLANPDA